VLLAGEEGGVRHFGWWREGQRKGDPHRATVRQLCLALKIKGVQIGQAPLCKLIPVRAGVVAFKHDHRTAFPMFGIVIQERTETESSTPMGKQLFRCGDFQNFQKAALQLNQLIGRAPAMFRSGRQGEAQLSIGFLRSFQGSHSQDKVVQAPVGKVDCFAGHDWVLSLTSGMILTLTLVLLI